MTPANTSKCVWIRKSVVKGRMHQTYSKQGHDSEHKMRRGNKVISKNVFHFSPYMLKTTPEYDNLTCVQKELCAFYFSASCRDREHNKTFKSWDDIIFSIYYVKLIKHSYANTCKQFESKKMNLSTFYKTQKSRLF